MAFQESPNSMWVVFLTLMNNLQQTMKGVLKEALKFSEVCRRILRKLHSQAHLISQGIVYYFKLTLNI